MFLHLKICSLEMVFFLILTFIVKVTRAVIIIASQTKIESIWNAKSLILSKGCSNDWK